MRLYRETGVEDNITMENPSGYSKIHQIRGKLTGMSLFRAADGMVRKVTVIGAYRKALAEGKNRHAAIEYAKEVNDDVNFDYSVVGTPHFMRQLGPIGTLTFQFKKYGIKELELISKMNGKERAKLLAPMLLLSGIFGVPGGDALKALIELLIPGDDDPDLEMEMKKWVSETSLPDPVKKTILYGALSNLGMDIGRRVGMGDFIPNEWADFAGPTFSTAYRTWNAVPKIFDDGNFFDTIEAVSPGLANPIKAIVGETKDKRRGRTRFKYETVGEKAARFTGVRPIREAIESDAVRISNYEQAKKSAREIDAIDDYVRLVEVGKFGTPEYEKVAKRLSELGITRNRLKTELEKRQAGSEYERKLRENRKKPEQYQFLQNYQGM
jgi:hypothetical protein